MTEQVRKFGLKQYSDTDIVADYAELQRVVCAGI